MQHTASLRNSGQDVAEPLLARTRSAWLGPVAMVAMVIAIIWAAVAASLTQEYRATEDAALAEAGNLARALEENLLRAVEAIDQQLLFIRTLYSRDPDYFDLSSEGRGAYLLRGLTFQVTIVDRNGFVAHSSLGPVTSRIDLSDREHVRIHRVSAEDRLFISKPLVGRVSGQMSVQFTRRMFDLEGRYAGVVVVSLDPRHLARFRASLDRASGDILIAGLDGIVRASAPSVTAVGTAITGTRLMEEVAKARQGVFRGKLGPDDPDSFIGFRRLEVVPLVVAVIMDAHEAMAGFRRNMWLFGGAGASLSLLAVGIGRVQVRRRQEQLRRSDATLVESEARFRHAFEVAGHGMFLSAPDGRFLRVNGAFRQILGYPEKMFEKLTLGDVTHPNEQARRAAWERTLAALEEPHHEATTRYVRADGATVWVRVNVGMVRGMDGQTLYYITHVRDITDQRRTEDKLRQAQKMEAVGQLTAGIAHDFNNLLGAVIGNLDIAREMAADDAEMTAHHIGEALGAALTGAELVKRLLAFGRRQSLRAVPTDLAADLRQTLPLMRSMVGERYQLRLDVAPDLWRAMADAVQVESALINLALNARDAMQDGGTITLSLSNATVEDGVTPAAEDLSSGDYVVIAMTDQGRGMEPDVLARAFEPFFTTKGVGAGSGLGLSMVIGTMQQLGGTVRIYSEAGIGTTVRLYLPRAQAEAAPAARAVEVQQPKGNEHILVVEDNPRIRHSVTVILESLGYRVSTADTADDALARWEGGERFDLVFSDLVMPGRLGGVDLARAIRARDPAARILLTTGFANSATLHSDIDAMRLEVLAKPYRKADLAVALRRVLDPALQETS